MAGKKHNSTLEAIQEFAQLAGESVRHEINEIRVYPISGGEAIKITGSDSPKYEDLVRVAIGLGGLPDSSYSGADQKKEIIEAGRKLAEVTTRRASEFTPFRLELRKARRGRPDDSPCWVIWRGVLTSTTSGLIQIEKLDGVIAIPKG